MNRSDTLRRGLLAGIFASLVLALFDFVTDGEPGNGFPGVLHWFGLTMSDPTISHWVGLLLLIVLGGVFGLIFGALGVLWWLLFEVVLANLTNHASSLLSPSFGQFLSSFPLAALFGVLLGAIFIQWQGQHEPRRPS